jgi:hypothetical protein
MSSETSHTTTFSVAGLTVERTVLADQVSRPTVRYTISSECDGPQTLSLFDRLSDGILTSDVMFDSDEEWEVLDSNVLSTTLTVVPSQRVDTEYTVDVSPERARTWLARPPQVTVCPHPQSAGVLLSDDARARTPPEMVGDGGEVSVPPGGFDVDDESPARETPAWEDSECAPDLPPIGLFAVGGNEGDVLRESIRASARGHPVFVAVDGGVQTESIRFVERLGARLVVVEHFDDDLRTARTALVGAAASHDHDGLIVAGTAAERIDYERSTAAVANRDEIAVDAVTEGSTGDEGGVMIGIPAYNEAGTIAEVVEAAGSYADTVVVIDDGSADDTVTRARDAGATVLQHDQNRGYGAALRTIFEEAADRQADHLVVLDADGQHDPSDVPKLVERQRSTDSDIVIGSRFVEGSETDVPPYRWLGITVVNVLLNLTMGTLHPSKYVSDTQSGFRVYSRRSVETLATDPEIGAGMNASTDILIHAERHGYDIDENPTTVNYDVENANSHHPLVHGFSLVTNLLPTLQRRRPLLVLGAPAALCLGVGVLLARTLLQNYADTGLLAMSSMVPTVLFFTLGTFGLVTSSVLYALKQAALTDS